MDASISEFRRKYRGPSLALPPIDEGGAKPLVNDEMSSPSTQSSGSQPFQLYRPTRRASIASFSSVKKEVKMQEIKAQLRRDSLKLSELQERRDSLTRRFELLQKKTSKNTELSTERKRRQSVVTLMPQGRRPSFRAIGNKVTNLLKVKNVFNRGVRKKPTFEVEEEEVVKASEIKELPKEPRFASTLSVEAQYAMMKGYEDVVYGYLSRSYPEYRPLLRRNRTPLTGVKVKVPDVTEDTLNTREDSDGGSSKFETREFSAYTPNGKDKVDGSVNLSASPNNSTNTSSRELKTVETSISPDFSSSNKGYNRLPTPPCYRSLPSSVASQRARESVTNLPRYNSLPHLVPKDKQLVMTYRYHSAMDILDQIKKNIGLHATSPRVDKSRASEPIRDFNLWSCVWNKEFETLSPPTSC